MSSTELVMSEIFSAVSSTTGIVNAQRGSDSIVNSSDTPCLVVSQGDESCERVTMDGRLSCDLDIDILIVCLKGTQNYETTLNNLKRNLITQLMSASFFFTIDETGSGAPTVEQVEGESLYSLSVQFNVNYTRIDTDPVSGEI